MSHGTHRTSAVYQAALAELRDRHPDEFEAIYDSKRAEAGLRDVKNMKQSRRVRQEAILDFIDAYWRDNGFGPSRPMITEAIGISTSTLSADLLDLAGRGLVELPGRGNYNKLLRTTRLAESA